MEKRLVLGEIEAVVVLKDIKNVHLSVYPPTGHVRISAPERMSLDNIRAYVVTKIDWIKAQRSKLQCQERTTPREYIDGESHFVWGKRYLLRVVSTIAVARVELKGGCIKLYVKTGTSPEHRQRVVEEWLRMQLRMAIPDLIEKWESHLGVRVERFYLQRMKTKWGSCSPARGAIRLNTELAKKPRECLEYIIVHEMMHLLEPTHNERFVHLMNQHMPRWRFYRDELNRLPVRHEDWKY